MRTMLGLAVAVVLAVPAIAGDKPRELIVGKWAPTNDKTKEYVFEFTRDGVLKVGHILGDKELAFEGKYKFIDENTFETAVDYTGAVKKERIKIVKISVDEMTTSDELKREETFRRLK
ncbi:MAG: hypothetical protein ACJ8F7_23280 [Gemmataceae bacterium]